jgi:hypothetical protein
LIDAERFGFPIVDPQWRAACVSPLFFVSSTEITELFRTAICIACDWEEPTLNLLCVLCVKKRMFNQEAVSVNPKVSPPKALIRF